MKILKKIFAAPNYLLNRLVFIYRNVECADFPTIAGRISLRGPGRLVIGKKVVINSAFNANPVGINSKTAFHIGPSATVKIGDKVGISNSLFYALGSITIEDNVLIGGGCQFLDSDFHSISYEERILGDDRQKNIRPILIKEGAFIGASCIILKGVTVGERSVVGAGAIVVKDIPAGEIWAGNPAKFIKKV